jgi:pyruvate/2-oxoglutarate dehydrogenase complex dihydrolipoamide acyltransferase (E2) component
MQVNLDIADAGITVGDKGILLSIADNSGSVLGHLRIGNAAVEWRKGASRAGRGKKIPLQQFLSALEESIEGGGSGAAAAAPAKRAAKATKAAKAAPAPVKRGRGRPRKNAAAPARPAAKRAARRASAVDTQAVRAWAQAQGLQISTRGRLPGSVLEQYRQANS